MLSVLKDWIRRPELGQEAGLQKRPYGDPYALGSVVPEDVSKTSISGGISQVNRSGVTPHPLSVCRAFLEAKPNKPVQSSSFNLVLYFLLTTAAVSTF